MIKNKIPNEDTEKNSFEYESRIKDRYNEDLIVLGLSWQQIKYRPDKSIHPAIMSLSISNSSKKAIISRNLSLNARGYNIIRANYPVQSGSWYFELKVTSESEVSKIIKNYNKLSSNNLEIMEEDFDSNKNRFPSDFLHKNLNFNTDSDSKPNDKKESSPYTNLLPQLQSMNILIDSSRRILPEPHWRIGWATEMADLEAPCGTDSFGFSWRDDGTIFHKAKPLVKTSVDENNIINNPRVQFHESGSEEKLDSYSIGDTLGFGIEIPADNFQYISEQWKHLESQISYQQTAYQLNQSLIFVQSQINHQSSSLENSKLHEELFQLKDKIKNLDKVKPFNFPPSLAGTRLYFWKNGVLQNIFITDIPPGSYYPSSSLYYTAASAFNFGPKFEFSPPQPFLPCSLLPDAYKYI